MDKLLIKRGSKRALEQLDPLPVGELFLAKDEERLYVGGPRGNIPIPTQKDLDEKATKTELQQVSLAYKESYNTLDDLKKAYPNGDVYNHVVLADGMIYTYAKGEWVSTGVKANGAIEFMKAYEDLKVLGVGRRNLIRNSDFGSDGVLDHWEYWGNTSSMSVESHYGYNFLKVTSMSNMRGEHYWFRRRPQEFNFVKGVKYTLSWIQVMSEGNADPRAVIRESGDKGIGFQQMLSNFQTETILRAEVYGLTRNFVKYSTTFEISDEFNEPIADIAWRFTNTRDGQEWVMISEPKLEKGNKATDWTPAPEDIDAHPFVVELAEVAFRSKQNEERIRNLEEKLLSN